MEISLRQLGYFLGLVEHRSFTAAAGALGITQPALSIAISQLERALDAKLIERGTLPVTLTQYGETFHRYALRIMRDLREAREEIAALGSGTLGRLDIGMGPSAAGPEVGSVLTGMIAEFPALEIHVHSGVLPAVAERIHSGEFSVYAGTVADDFSDPGLDVVPLATLDLIAVAGAAHPLASRPRVTASDLVAYPWIAIGNLDVNLPGWTSAFIDAGVEPPHPAIDVRNIALVRSLLIEGRFVTILPRSLVRDDFAAGLFAPVHPPSFDWTLRLFAVTRAGVTLPAAARVFVERLRAAYGDAEH
jgi:DNA-binding transcriptional LysR family regulator